MSDTEQPYDGIIKQGSYQELWLDKTSRPSYHNINTICTPDGIIRFGVNPDAIDLMGMKILSAIEEGPPDALVTALGMAFNLMVKRFNLHTPTLMAYLDQYMRGPELKPSFHGMEYLLARCYDDKVKRSEVVHFKPIKVDFTKPPTE